VAIAEAVLGAGAGARDLPRGAPREAVWRGWQKRLDGDLACLDHAALLEIGPRGALLKDAVAGDARQLRERLRGVGGNGRVRATESLDEREYSELLSNHPDPWVRACARAAGLAESVSGEESQAIVSVIERVLFLKETDVFMEVDISDLIHVAERLEPRTFAAGETIVENGGDPGGIYFIQGGEVEVSQLRDGRRVGIATLGAHDSVGDLSALNDTPATADCMAITPTECWYIPSEHVATLLHEHPRLGVGLIRMLSQRLIATTLRVHQTVIHAPPALTCP
jgi:CRP-like cAMP-binding protein